MLLKFAKKMLPKISNTENIALRSGTVSIDRNIFSGNLSLDKLQKYKIHKLTKIDDEMLKKGKELSKLINESKILLESEMKPNHEFWNYVKKYKFFGLNISEKYGGKPMSITGQSKLFQRMSSVSGSGSVHLMVPNSLGPAELLHHYGSEDQKNI